MISFQSHNIYCFDRTEKDSHCAELSKMQSISNLLTQTKFKNVRVEKTVDGFLGCRFVDFDNIETYQKVSSKSEDPVKRLVCLFVKHDIQEVWEKQDSDETHPGIKDIRYRNFGTDSDWKDFVLVDDVRKMNSASWFRLGTKLSLYDGELTCRLKKDLLRDNFNAVMNLGFHRCIDQLENFSKDDEFIYFTTVHRNSTLMQLPLKANKIDALLWIMCGFEFMRDKNICHGAIHENNVRWDRKKPNGWSISGLIREDEEKKAHDIPKDDYFKSPFRNEIPNDPRNDFWQMTWLAAKIYFELKQEDFGFAGEFKYPHGTAADKKLMETELGRRLKKMLIYLPEKADYDVLRDILKTMQETCKVKVVNLEYVKFIK